MTRRTGAAFTLIELLVVIAIIAVLAGMLLPVLGSAREKSRRAGCMNNLRQMGIMLESYLSDYGGNYPCFPAQGRAPQPVRETEYQWQMQDETAPGKSVYATMWAQNIDYGYNQYNYHPRMIAAGARTDGSTPTAGRQNVCPYGLGYLLWGTYMPDVRTLFCPTTAGGNVSPATAWYGPGPRMYGRPNYRLTHYQKTGGFDRKSVFFGDYSWWVIGAMHAASGGTYMDADSVGLDLVMGVGTWGVPANARAALCDYIYRGLPVVAMAGYYDMQGPGTDWPYFFTAGDSPDPAEHPNYPEYMPYTTPINVRYTRPLQRAVGGCAEFKTPKQLGERAIVSDSFGKNGMWVYDPNLKFPNDGLTCHREGYNVLYGDGSVRWYGDPELRIAWMDGSPNNAWWGLVANWSTALAAWCKTDVPNEQQELAGTFNSALGWGGISPDSPEYREDSMYAVFHWFDVAKGVDVW